MWRNNQFQLVNFVRGNNFSVVEGVWKGGGGVQVVIVNVYSPSLLREKKVLWEDIGELRRRQNNRVWCVIGDFNSVRRQEERRSLFSPRLITAEISEGLMTLLKILSLWMYCW